MGETYIEAFSAILTLLVLFSAFFDSGRRRRRKEFKIAAEKENFNFWGSKEIYWLSFADSQFLSRGYHHRMSNLIECKAGNQTMWVADFFILANIFSLSSIRANVTVCIIEDRTVKLPCFVLQPRKNSKATEYEEVILPGNCRLSGQFLLSAKDEHLVRYLFAENTMEFFNRYAEEDFIIETFENKILFSKGWRLIPGTFPSLVRETLEIKEMLKKTVEKLELYS